MRSKLFVPGARPELFAKALASQADALSFDLEDAVAAERKAQARVAVAAFVAGGQAAAARKRVIVRTNAPDSVHFAADLAAVARPGVDLITCPRSSRRSSCAGPRPRWSPPRAPTAPRSRRGCW